MKAKLLPALLIMALVLGLGFVSPVKAAGYGTSFLTSITYLNVGTGPASIVVDFYQEGATTVTKSYTVATLTQGAAASLGIGSVFTTSFKGSAIMSSNQPLIGTLVQVPASGSSVKNRPMSNGFTGGSTSVLIPTVLKGIFNANTIFSIQNAGSADASVTLKFVHTTAGSDYTETFTLPRGSAKYFDMGVYSNAGATFNGSATVTSTQPVVASALELSTKLDAVYAFEGVSGGATTLYMPSAMCRLGGTSQTSYYAIQNTSTSSAATVSVRYIGTVGSTPVDSTINLGSVSAGAKISVSGCGEVSGSIPASIGNGFIGSAIVTSTQNVVAVSKIVGAGAFQTAHVGTTSGAQKLAAPYVRYSDTFFSYTSTRPIQRANIAIQNVGTSTIPANSITVKFVAADGSVQATYTYNQDLVSGAKFSINPKTAGKTEFGYTAGGDGLPSSYGGGAIIEGPSGAQLAGVVRVETSTAYGNVAEDYNTQPVANN